MSTGSLVRRFKSSEMLRRVDW